MNYSQVSTLSASSTGSPLAFPPSSDKSFSPDLIDHNEKSTEGIMIAENMEEYLKQVWEENGWDAAYKALETFFKVMERKEIVIYEIDEQEVTPEEYMKKTLQDIIRPEATSENIPEERSKEEMENDIIEWDELISQLLWTKEEEISQFEVLIKKNYQDYKSLLEAEARNLQDRNTLSYQLAKNVADWAHLKVEQPNQFDQQSVNKYLTDKQMQLKMIAPGITTHRSLTQKMKFIDNWGKYNIMIGTDQNAGWGSVAQQP